MSYKFWSGVIPGTGSRALLACLVVLGTTLGATQSVAARARGVEFSGQLNYETFQRAAEQNRSVRISYSPGGTGAAALALARVNKVIVDGQCNSACAWSFVKNAGACFTPRASFGFHAAHDPGTGRRLNAATGYWLSTVRASLRPRLEGLLSSSSLIRVSASEMRRYYSDRVCGAEPRTEVASRKALPRTVVASAETKPAKSRGAEQRVANLEAAAPKADKAASEGRRDGGVSASRIEAGPWHYAFTRAASSDTATAVEIGMAVALLPVPEMNEASSGTFAWSWLGEHGGTSTIDRSSISANDARASAAGAVAMAGLVLVGDELPEPALLDARIAALFKVVDGTSEAQASFQSALVCAEGSSCAEALGDVAMLSQSGETALDDMITGGIVPSTLQEFAERRPDSLIELSDESAGPCSADPVHEAALSKTHI